MSEGVSPTKSRRKRDLAGIVRAEPDELPEEEGFYLTFSRLSSIRISLRIVYKLSTEMAGMANSPLK